MKIQQKYFEMRPYAIVTLISCEILNVIVSRSNCALICEPIRNSHV